MPTTHLKRSIRVAGVVKPVLLWVTSPYREAYKTGAAMANEAIKGAATVYKTGVAVTRRIADEVAEAIVSDADKIFDGYYVGKGATPFPPSSALNNVPPVLPEGYPGKAPDPVIYVNGIRTSLKGHADSLKAIASQGLAVVGIYNATAGADGANTLTRAGKGMVGDLGQSLGDKLDLGDNKAVDTLTKLIYSRVKISAPMHIIAHSQGALITSRALNHTIDRLAADRAAAPEMRAEFQEFKTRFILSTGGRVIITDSMLRAAFKESLKPRITQSGQLSIIKVETYGGAAYTYPDGPRYIHSYNKGDKYVPMLVGQGVPFAHPGRDAVVIPFNEPYSNPVDAHSFDKVYLRHRCRQSFDELYQSRYCKIQEHQ